MGGDPLTTAASLLADRLRDHGVAAWHVEIEIWIPGRRGDGPQYLATVIGLHRGEIEISCCGAPYRGSPGLLTARLLTHARR